MPAAAAAIENRGRPPEELSKRKIAMNNLNKLNEIIFKF